jgi:hypothetical protein
MYYKLVSYMFCCRFVLLNRSINKSPGNMNTLIVIYCIILIRTIGCQEACFEFKNGIDKYLKT